MAKNMAYALLCILGFAIQAQSGLGLSTSTPHFGYGAQLKNGDVGTFNMINQCTLPIHVHCHDYAGPAEIFDLGNYNMASGSSYMNSVLASATSVLCSFNLAGGSEQDLAIWVNNDPNNTLPVECIDCKWVIDERGFSLQNPGTGQYIRVAGWVSS